MAKLDYNAVIFFCVVISWLDVRWGYKPTYHYGVPAHRYIHMYITLHSIAVRYHCFMSGYLALHDVK